MLTLQSDGLIINSLKASSVVGGQEEVLFTMMPNIIEIKVQVPNGYWGDLEINVWNSHYDDDIPIDLCGISIISVGKNMPCLDVTTQVAFDDRAIDSKTLPDGRTMRRGISVVLKGVCYIHADQRYEMGRFIVMKCRFFNKIFGVTVLENVFLQRRR